MPANLNLADGQLPNSSTALYTAAATGYSSGQAFVNVIGRNTSGVNTETVIVGVKRSGGTTRSLFRAVLSPNEAFEVQNIPLDVGDAVMGQTTDASTVDYVVSNGSGGSVAFTVYDSSGLPKSKQISGVGNAVNNLTATTDPAQTNDNTQGYASGSLWINTSNSNVWTCVSAATGAAVWNLSGQNLSSFRNLLDGGDFTINPWQRGTSFTAIVNAVTYTADRWFADAANASNSISVSQQAPAGIPAGFTNSLQWGRAAANTDTHAIYLGQVLESADCIRTQGQQVTLSFWAKAGANFSSASSALTVQLNHSTTAGNDTAAHLVAASTNWQSPPTIINGTATLTTSWQRFQFTGTVPSGCTQLGVLFSYTTVGTAGANDWVQFAGVQLELGGNATPFEHRDIEIELEKCQRYFFQINEPGAHVVVGPGQNNAANNQTIFIPLPVQMRTAPTVTITNGGFKINVAGTETAVGTGFAAGATHTVNYVSVVDNLTGTVGQAVLLVGSNSTGSIAVSADF